MVLSLDGPWEVSTECGSHFVNPGRLIPAVTMAAHHIVDADVVDAPSWRELGPAVLRPTGGVVALAAHSAAFEQRFCTPELTCSARWICTWKCALRLYPDSPRFSNQVLRYWRKPVGLERELGLPVHRALPDAYVTAHLLRDMLNTTTLEELLAWSAEPGLLPRVPAGPHRGLSWNELDDDVLRCFLDDRDENMRFTATTEIERRKGDAALPVAQPRQGQLL